ncbi:MAG: hypothetical protein ACE5JI_03080 [Acidobacteriota bacterium]
MASEDGCRRPEFRSWVERAGIDLILVSDSVRGDIERVPEELERQFRTFLEENTSQVAQVRDVTYGRIDIHRVLRPEL